MSFKIPGERESTMMGFVMLVFALIATGIAACYYVVGNYAVAERIRQVGLAKKALFYYRISSTLIGVAGVYLLMLLLTDRFQYAYVFGYSARALPFAYKVSAFWAGQEGSFFLWLLFHSSFGWILTRNRTAGPGAMAAYCVLQALLLVILLVKSPFRMLPELAADGAGLNLLLQDPWMVIHPPLVFLGYAGLAVPFVLAIGGLFDNDHKTWPIQALPWALFAWTVLGAGIFIGGFWAYKVLGWGGYWAWDPVENSSFVPWLFTGAFIHFLLVGARRPVGVKGAYILATFTFVMVLYGTFLTRSGALSDFSVHSFADEGIGGLFAVFLPSITIGAFAPLIIRWPGLPEGSAYTTVRSREFLLVQASVVLCLFAILVFVGMSTPLITSLLGAPYSVGSDFYNTTALPVVAAILLLATLAPLVRWGTDSTNMAAYCWLFALGIAAAVWGGWLGQVSLWVPANIGLAVMAIVSNLVMTVHRRLSRPAALAHIGVAVITIGILVSSAGSESRTVNFTPGEKHNLFGTEIVYQGVELPPGEQSVRHNFQVGGAGSTPLWSLSKLNKAGRIAVREPGIYRGWNADLYLSPLNSLGQQGPIAVEVSQKPCISLVWLGAVLITVGIGWAGFSRLNDSIASGK
jgi:cytochrome c-type biogenesis protein CcmF